MICFIQEDSRRLSETCPRSWWAVRASDGNCEMLTRNCRCDPSTLLMISFVQIVIKLLVCCRHTIREINIWWVAIMTGIMVGWSPVCLLLSCLRHHRTHGDSHSEWKLKISTFGWFSWIMFKFFSLFCFWQISLQTGTWELWSQPCSSDCIRRTNSNKSLASCE